MALFPSRPVQPTAFKKTINKYPGLFGLPFVLIMVLSSFALTPFTQTRYDLQDKKVQQVTKEQELHLDKNRKKFDIREEYYRLSAASDQEWEPKRVPRPKGVPEWGVPPTEPSK